MLQQLGKYRIDSVLGKGAMGMVYKAFDPHIARTVALKTIRKELFGEGQQAELISRFKNEAQAAGRLSHPHIVAVYDYGEDDSAAYIAMEFIEGRALGSLLVPGQPTGLARAMAWMTQLLGALDYAHARGVVHRDIKPANLIITAQSQVKVSDFGIARIDSSTLTQTGSMIGTPSYMSPEQFRGDPVDGRSDVFSAAIVLYQLLTGQRAFSGSATVVMQQILNQMPAPPSSLNPALDPAFDAIVARALAKLPEQRYPSAQAFLEALLGKAATTPSAMPDGAAASSDETDDDRTMLASPALPYAPPIDTGAGLSWGGNASASAGADTLAAWKLAVLPELDTLLSHQIGPMAKFLLKKAAARADDLQALCQSLLPHIPSERGRQQFSDGIARIEQRLHEQAQADASALARTAGLENSANAANSAYAANAANPANAADDAPRAASDATADPNSTATAHYDQAFADATQRRLAVAIGPIAKVLVNRTARRTDLREEFLQLLAEHIESERERSAFLHDAHLLDAGR